MKAKRRKRAKTTKKAKSNKVTLYIATNSDDQHLCSDVITAKKYAMDNQFSGGTGIVQEACSEILAFLPIMKTLPKPSITKLLVKTSTITSKPCPKCGCGLV